MSDLTADVVRIIEGDGTSKAKEGLHPQRHYFSLVYVCAFRVRELEVCMRLLVRELEVVGSKTFFITESDILQEIRRAFTSKYLFQHEALASHTARLRVVTCHAVS